ncbi:MAG: FtsX-like permease family protein [Pseudomonadota bacterium]
MSALKLIWHSLRHGWLRNLLLLLSIVIAYALFGTLMAFERAYGVGASDGANRMITANKLSFTQLLPISHFRDVRRLDGVGKASFAAWFGGYYREPRNFLHTLAIDPQSYLDLYGDDIELTEAERQDFLNDRGSVLVGSSKAESHGWRVGDRIPLFNRRIARRDGAETWEFRVAGIFKGATPQIDTTFLYIHYEMFNEARAGDRDTIGWIVTLPAAGIKPGQMGQAIDRFFDTYADRTTTDSERSFSQTFVAQFGDLAQVTILVLSAAFFSLLVIVASTTALAIRQRSREIGVLKALGYSHMRVLVLLIGESIALVGIAGFAGLGLAAVLVQAAAPSMVQIAPGMAISLGIVGVALASMMVLAVAASALPAWQAVRQTTSDVLRRG